MLLGEWLESVTFGHWDGVYCVGREKLALHLDFNSGVWALQYELEFSCWWWKLGFVLEFRLERMGWSALLRKGFGA